jgi:hypothetical protein
MIRYRPTTGRVARTVEFLEAADRADRLVAMTDGLNARIAAEFDRLSREAETANTGAGTGPGSSNIEGSGASRNSGATGGR